MKKFDKDLLTVWSHINNAGSMDFTMPIFRQMNNAENLYESVRSENERMIFCTNSYISDLKKERLNSGYVKLFAEHIGVSALMQEIISERNGNVNRLLNWREPIGWLLSGIAYTVNCNGQTIDKSNITRFLGQNKNMFLKTVLRRHSELGGGGGNLRQLFESA
jgi:hypothetical protein